MAKNLLILAGDGAGPDIAAVPQKVLARLWPDLQTRHAPAGGAALETHGDPLPAETVTAARGADAVLLGAFGGPQWADATGALRPQAALPRLYRELDLYAEVSAIVCLRGLEPRSALRGAAIEGASVLVVADIAAGAIGAEPSGRARLSYGWRAVDTLAYRSGEIRRVARIAFDLARDRRQRVTCVADGDGMEIGRLWRDEVRALAEQEFSDVELDLATPAAALARLAGDPRACDVLVADSLLGPLLTATAASALGAVGVTPRAVIGMPGSPELVCAGAPAPGGGPDPIAALLAVAMAVERPLGRPDLAARMRRAVATAVAEGAYGRSLGGALTAAEVADAVLERLDP